MSQLSALNTESKPSPILDMQWTLLPFSNMQHCREIPSLLCLDKFIVTLGIKTLVTLGIKKKRKRRGMELIIKL